MGYQYRGTIHDLNEPAYVPPRKHDGFEPDACGTYAGYRRHQKWGVPACQDCRDAMAAYSRDRYVKRPPKTFNPDKCGTWAGWLRHRYYGVPACEACQDAGREYQRQYRARRRAERVNA